MTAQDFAEITPSANDTTMLALWMSSGGAVEALSAGDAANARNRRRGVDDDGLTAGNFTTNPFSCADEGLAASSVTKGYGCIPPSTDDGLRACGNTPVTCPGAI